MNNHRTVLKKLTSYFIGLMIMTLGVILSVKSDLGVTPISSIPYTMTVVSGLDLGVATMLFSTLMVLLQIVVLRKQYKLINLLQLPIGLIFGAFMTASGQLMQWFPEPETLLFRFLLMLFSTIVVAFGVFLYISPDLVPLPPEGFVLSVATVTQKSFPSIKVIFDVSMVIISMTTCLLIIHSLGSVGVGTIVAAVLVGNEVKVFTRVFSARNQENNNMEHK